MEIKELNKIKERLPYRLRRQILSEYHSDECADITNKGKRCKLATEYKHHKTGQIKDCSEYCGTYLTKNCEKELLDVFNRLVYGEVIFDKEMKGEGIERKEVRIKTDDISFLVSLMGGKIILYTFQLGDKTGLKRSLGNKKFDIEFNSDLTKFIKMFCKKNPKRFKFEVFFDSKDVILNVLSIGGIKKFVNIKKMNGYVAIKNFDFTERCVIL